MTTGDPRIGEVFLDRLKVLRHIGGGGMGAVYEVEHLRTGHHRALKIVRPEYSAQPRYMQRLLREARVAATLKTVHVAETLDAGLLEDGSAYVLMELLEGRPLIALLEERSQLEPEEVVWIATEICQGLTVAHAAGIVHRDLKPENIFLVPSGEDGALVKILDFGISQFPASMAEAPTRLTRQGTILGTPFYMSPEQAAGRAMDARTDIYALGVLMYEALSGTLPFDCPTIGELFLRIAAGEYTPLEQRVPTLDPNLVAVVARAMSRDPDDRFDSAAQLMAGLAPFLGRGPAAPGRITLRLNALVQPAVPRVDTLDYATAIPSRECETAAMDAPAAVYDSYTPPVGTALPTRRHVPPASEPPASESAEAAPQSSQASVSRAMAVASTPPAGILLRSPSSVPPPPSIPAALVSPGTAPAASKSSDWRWPLALAVLAAVAAFSWSLVANNQGATTPIPEPVANGFSEADASPSTEPVSADAGAVVVDTVDAGASPASANAVPRAAEDASARTRGKAPPTKRSSSDSPPNNHHSGRPSHAAGLDPNPY